MTRKKAGLRKHSANGCAVATCQLINSCSQQEPIVMPGKWCHLAAGEIRDLDEQDM